MSASTGSHSVIGMGKRAAVLGGLIAVLAAASVTGCGLARREFSDDHTVEASISEVRLSGGSGSVTVTAGADGPAKVHRQVRYDGNRPGSTYRLDGSVLDVPTRCGTNCTVAYTITVPTAVKVTGHNGSGRIDLRGVSAVSVRNESGAIVVRGASASVSARTSSGSIELSDVQGDATARTSSGSVRLTGVAGAVVAESSSGSIRGIDLRGSQTSVHSSSGAITVEPAQPQRVYAQSSSGSVELRLPEGSYQVRTQTSSGRVAVNVPQDPAGTYLIDVHTSSGRITIDRR